MVGIAWDVRVVVWDVRVVVWDVRVVVRDVRVTGTWCSEFRMIFQWDRKDVYGR